MQDGTLWNGPQPLERDFAWTIRRQRNIEDARNLTYGLFFPSWRPSSLADGVMEKNIDEIARMHEAIPPGVNTRIGVSVLTPPKVADLIGVKDRKYLDLIARIRRRNIGDLMRYVNFEPGEKALFADRKTIPSEAMPKASQMFRFRDEQAFALAM